jgi:hypothetical protein
VKLLRKPLFRAPIRHDPRRAARRHNAGKSREPQAVARFRASLAPRWTAAVAGGVILACGHALPNAGHDTRALQAYLGQISTHGKVYQTAPDRF